MVIFLKNSLQYGTNEDNIEDTEDLNEQFYENEIIKYETKENNDEQKAYQCEKCEKSYTAVHNLYSHVKIVHDGIKPHKCEFCNKEFTNLGNKKQHIKINHNELLTHI